MNLATVLTVRTNSDRLPGKALLKINKQPLVYWITKRLLTLPGKVILATTDDSSDDKLAAYGAKLGLPVYRDDSSEVDDVVGRISRAVAKLYPQADLVFRALGDCPFIEPSIVQRAGHTILKHKADFFLWYLPPDIWPVYGAREFPYARSAFNKIANYARSRLGEREHVDMYFNHNRGDFRVVYHEGPPPDFFRPRYRLEVDYEDDLKMLAAATKAGLDMLWPLKKVIWFLDDNPAIPLINAHCTEKTGLTVSYTRKQLRDWYNLMQSRPVVSWHNEVWNGPDRPKARQVFCKSEQCLIGWGLGGRLFMLDGSEITSGRINCKCGAGRVWEQSI